MSVNEPPRRADGLCVVCAKPGQVTVHPKARAASSDPDREPFCSTKCAKSFYGTDVSRPKLTP